MHTSVALNTMREPHERMERIDSFRVHNLNHFWFNAFSRDFHTNSLIAPSPSLSDASRFHIFLHAWREFDSPPPSSFLDDWVARPAAKEKCLNISQCALELELIESECVSYYDSTGTLLIKIDLLSRQTTDTNRKIYTPSSAHKNPVREGWRGQGIYIILEYVQRFLKRKITRDGCAGQRHRHTCENKIPLSRSLSLFPALLAKSNTHR